MVPQRCQASSYCDPSQVSQVISLCECLEMRANILVQVYPGKAVKTVPTSGRTQSLPNLCHLHTFFLHFVQKSLSEEMLFPDIIKQFPLCMFFGCT